MKLSNRTWHYLHQYFTAVKEEQQAFARTTTEDVCRSGYSSLSLKPTCNWTNQHGELLDSTTMSLCLSKYKWDTYRKTKARVKLHLRVTFCNPNTVYPEKAVLISAKPSDRTQMDALTDETGATYVFDRGYEVHGIAIFPENSINVRSTMFMQRY
ncbi:transposase [Paenibacillus albiflavus]|nr:transposase [Paenibacillus albiflavus]